MPKREVHERLVDGQREDVVAEQARHADALVGGEVVDAGVQLGGGAGGHPEAVQAADSQAAHLLVLVAHAVQEHGVRAAQAQ